MYDIDYTFNCTQFPSTDCALKLQNRTADFGMFKAEEAILTSHFLEGVTVIGDIRHEDRTDRELFYLFHLIKKIVAQHMSLEKKINTLFLKQKSVEQKNMFFYTAYFFVT